MNIHSLFAAFLLTIGIAVITGFSMEKQNPDLITFVVTVESNDAGMSAPFDIAITTNQGESTEFKLLTDQHTPFTIELTDANHLIVVHKTSEAGVIKGKVEKHKNGGAKSSAGAEGNVVVLTTEKDGKVASFGM